MLLAKSRPIVVIFIADGSHFARERLMAFTPWHLDAVSGSHPPHLLMGGKADLALAPLATPSTATYLCLMHRSRFEPCIPSPGTKVPDSKDWIHEIKHDGYRLIVQRDGDRVRLFTRNGHDWSGRFPLITEAALRNRNSSFVI